jgi:hypothetical protein
MRQISMGSIEPHIFTLMGVVAPVVGTGESGASLQPKVGVPRSAGRLRPMDNEEPPSDIKKTNTHQSYILVVREWIDISFCKSILDKVKQKRETRYRG